jgi:hypothetical protein
MGKEIFLGGAIQRKAAALAGNQGQKEMTFCIFMCAKNPGDLRHRL